MPAANRSLVEAMSNAFAEGPEPSSQLLIPLDDPAPGGGLGNVPAGNVADNSGPDKSVAVFMNNLPPADDSAEAANAPRLTLRRPPMQRRMLLRSRLASSIRHALEDEGFAEIETPTPIRPTPEGARDSVLPSRLQPGTRIRMVGNGFCQGTQVLVGNALAVAGPACSLRLGFGRGPGFCFEGGLGGVLDEGGGVEVRFAGAEADDVHAGLAQRGGLRGHRERDRFGNQLHPVRQRNHRICLG